MNLKSLSSAIQFVKERPTIGIILISAFYFFGILGILSEEREWFIDKTAFNLCLSFIILLIYQKQYAWSLLWGFAFCYVIGYLAEYLGVNFGLIFGEYAYPDTLGPQLGGVPLIIGINWFLLTFCVASLLFPVKIFVLGKILLATLGTVLIDVIIEPVAMELNFWNWEFDVIPLQNFLGWAVISFLIFCFYFLVKIPLKNKIAKPLLFWQIVFFAVLNLVMGIM